MSRIISRYATANLVDSSLDRDFIFDGAVRLQTVYIAFSEPVTEEVVIKYKSSASSNYDTIVAEHTLTEENNYVFAVRGIVAINEEESLNVSVSNANTTGRCFVTVKAESFY
jgi:hypothetical protein